MSPDEALIGAVQGVYLFSPEGGLLKKLWSGDSQGIGTLVMTSRRLLFVKAKRGGQMLAGGPAVKTASEASELLAAQGGLEIDLPQLEAADVTDAGLGGYGMGHAQVSDLTVKLVGAAQTKRFRFPGRETANDVRQMLLYLKLAAGAPPAGEAPAVSPVAEELAALDIPPDYGLPVPKEQGMVVAWLRAGIGYAYRTLQKGELDFAIRDATALIEDPNLQSGTRYALLLAAAHYVRGLAHERQGDAAAAARDYRSALGVVPNYRLARSAAERLG